MACVWDNVSKDEDTPALQARFARYQLVLSPANTSIIVPRPPWPYRFHQTGHAQRVGVLLSYAMLAFVLLKNEKVDRPGVGLSILC